MEVTLPPELKQFVDAKVQAGYGSASEVVRDALRLWQHSEDGDTIRGDELARLIAVGQAQADRGELLDGPSTFAELYRRSAARQTAQK